jgi:hypothetical protein
MCMHVFAPAQCIDIDLLLEQVWFSEGEDGSLSIQEAYDLRVTNPAGNSSIDHIFVLFSHNCTELAGNLRIPKIVFVDMRPPRQKAYEYLEWFYSSEAQWEDSTTRLTIQRSYVGTELELWLEGNSGKSGKPLRGKCTCPLQGSEGNLMARLNHTLVRVDFTDVHLSAGETGWFRLVVTPRITTQWPARPIEFRLGPAMNLTRRRLIVHCPASLRKALETKLVLEQRNAPENDEVTRTCGRQVEDVLFDKHMDVAGTTTRIADHRIALVAKGHRLDICEASSSRGIAYVGELSLSPTDALPEDLIHGLWWAGGSDRNQDKDLVHNIRRVIDRLVFKRGDDIKVDVIRDLAPSGKHEAQAFLVENMILKGLLNQGEGRISLPVGLFDRNTSRLNEAEVVGRVVNLRKLYTSTASMTDRNGALYREFRDVHPFRINFRLDRFSSA